MPHRYPSAWRYVGVAPCSTTAPCRTLGALPPVGRASGRGSRRVRLLSGRTREEALIMPDWRRRRRSGGRRECPPPHAGARGKEAVGAGEGERRRGGSCGFEAADREAEKVGATRRYSPAPSPAPAERGRWTSATERSGRGQRRPGSVRSRLRVRTSFGSSRMISIWPSMYPALAVPFFTRTRPLRG